MGHCANCNKRLFFFNSIKYSASNNKQELIYCRKCFLEIKEKERESLINTLKSDDLIINFAEKFYPICLVLNYKKFNKIIPIRRGANLFGLDSIDEYNSLIEKLNANNITSFAQIKDIEYSNIESNLWTDKLVPEHSIPTYNYISEDFIKYEQSGEIQALLKLIDLILRKKGNINREILFHSLYEKANQIISEELSNLFNTLNSKDIIYNYLIDNYLEYLSDHMRLWEKRYILLLIQEINKKEFFNIKNIIELGRWMKNVELNSFENFLLDKEKEQYNIDDIDLMDRFEFEAFITKLFVKMGYKAIQTKFSGDQGADLIIEKNNRKTVVQTKCYSGKVGNKAIQEVAGSLKYYGAESGIVVTNSYFTNSAISLADSNGIRLIQRDKLIELVKRYLNS